MELLTEELRKVLPPIYSQEADLDPIVYARFVLPGTNWAWHVAEGEAQEKDFLFFGYVVGPETEFDFFLLSQLEVIRTPSGAQVERDLTFTEGRLTDVVAPDP